MYICVYTYIGKYIWRDVCIYVYREICVYIRIYTHTHIYRVFDTHTHMQCSKNTFKKYVLKS